MRVNWMLTALVACGLAGCTEIFEAETGSSADPGAEPSAQAADSQSSPQKPPTGLPQLNPGQSGTERVKAQAGVAAAGRSLDNETGVAGVVVEPAKALFAFKENAVFKLQIPQALQLFKATEGRLPQSDEEFMTKIVKANNLKLPKLPPGQNYVYDPQRGELMVERPTD